MAIIACLDSNICIISLAALLLPSRVTHQIISIKRSEYDHFSISSCFPPRCDHSAKLQYNMSGVTTVSSDQPLINILLGQ